MLISWSTANHLLAYQWRTYTKRLDMGHNSPLKIFLLDDDLFCLKMYELHLGVLGHKDIKIYQTETACMNDLSQQPDVIFLDEGMDMFNGPGILKKIKQFNPDIYVVFLCTLEKTQHAMNLLKYGAFDYIIKGENDLDSMKKTLRRINEIKELLNSRQNILSGNN